MSPFSFKLQLIFEFLQQFPFNAESSVKWKQTKNTNEKDKQQIQALIPVNSTSKSNQTMWPLKLDMTKEECRGVLRRLGM